MEFADVVRKRHMVRKFTTDPIPPEVVKRLLDNARRGPSAGFSQGMAFLVLQGEDLDRFWPLVTDQDSEMDREIAMAPLVIVPMSCKRIYLDRYAQPDKGWTDRSESHWPVPFWTIDTAMAALLVLLTAVDEELGALYFGIMPESVQPFCEEFGIPDDHEPIGAIAIGYNAEDKPRDLRSRRRPLADIVHFGQWGRRADSGVTDPSS